MLTLKKQSKIKRSLPRREDIKEYNEKKIRLNEEKIKQDKQEILTKKEELFAQYLVAGRKNEALHVLDALLKEQKTMYSYLQKGQIYLSQQKYTNATDALLLAVSFGSKEKIQLIKAHELGLEKTKKLLKKDQKSADKKLNAEQEKKLQKLSNTLGQSYFFLAISYFERADWLNAQRTFKKAEKYETHRSHSEKMLQFLATIGYS